jgi:hypothetical protein
MPEELWREWLTKGSTPLASLRRTNHSHGRLQMPSYHSVTMSTSVPHWSPTREFIIATTGALIAAGEPRYATLGQYVEQFAAPLSQLAGQGLYSFYDPCLPELTLIVECEAAEVCERCGTVIDACGCSF